MNLIQLQAMMGHSSLDMTRAYIQMLDEDLIEAHKAYGPIDSFL
jgi:site-specific recombinase XerD